jgi:hypothetical protein
MDGMQQAGYSARFCFLSTGDRREGEKLGKEDLRAMQGCAPQRHSARGMFQSAAQAAAGVTEE